MPEEVSGLLLSEVQGYNPSDFTRCRVRLRYDEGILSITPHQARALSIAQDYFQGLELSPEIQRVLAGCPPELVKLYTHAVWRDVEDVKGVKRRFQAWGVTQPACAARYDLLTDD